MRLYELTNDYRALMYAIENDELPEEAIQDTLEALTGEIELKADNIACLLKNIESDIVALKAEEDRLAERRKSKQKTRERLMAYLSSELLRSGMTKVETPRNRITFRKSESVVVDEDVFCRWANGARDDLLTFEEPKPNKAAIKQALKDGQTIEGAAIIQKYNMNIQ